MMTQEPDVGKVVIVASDQGRKERLVAYLAAGRSFEKMSEAELDDAFRRVYAVLSEDAIHPVARQLSEHLASEYAHRELPQPIAKHPDLFEGFIRGAMDHAACLDAKEKAAVDREVWAAYDRARLLRH